jgi:uncharacterized damage-inducible protein DinB
MTKHQYRAFAKYNQIMNQKLYGTAAKLSAADLVADKGAFFKSVQGTLQHIMVADLVWLRRFAALPNVSAAIGNLEEFPSIQSLNQEVHPDFQKLTELRVKLDKIISTFVEVLDDQQLPQNFKYTNMKGEQFERELWVCISHFFNHQTHHRGQATTLLTQMGLDVGVTDFVFVIHEQ